MKAGLQSMAIVAYYLLLCKLFSSTIVVLFKFFVARINNATFLVWKLRMEK